MGNRKIRNKNLINIVVLELLIEEMKNPAYLKNL